MNRRRVGLFGAVFCGSVALVLLVLMAYSVNSFVADDILASPYFFGAFLWFFGVAGCAVYAYYLPNSQVSVKNSSSEKKPESSGASAYKTFPAGCEVMEANGSTHRFEQEIILYLPKDYVEAEAPETPQVESQDERYFEDVK